MGESRKLLLKSDRIAPGPRDRASTVFMSTTDYLIIMTKPPTVQSVQLSLAEANARLQIAIDALRQCPTIEAFEALRRLGVAPDPQSLADFVSHLFAVTEEMGLASNYPLVKLEELGLYPSLTLGHWRELMDLLDRPAEWAQHQYEYWSADRNGSTAS